MTDLAERLREEAGTYRFGTHEAETSALLREAATALEAAQEDVARLDWLDTKRADDVRGSYPEEPQLVGHYWSVDGQCYDVRAAIDAARKEAP